MERTYAYDRYWRLRGANSGTKAPFAESLARAGYNLKPSASKTEVLKLHHRIDMGLICNDQCTEEELLTFDRARKLSIADSHSDTPDKKFLVKQLLAADHNPTFDRFLSLPPELRTRIYEYYDSAFPKKLYKPSQPPLARVCKQLRLEFLPIFFASHTFAITLTSCNHLQRSRFRFDDYSAQFLNASLSPEAISEIRSEQVTIDRRWGLCKKGEREDRLGSFAITLSNAISAKGYCIKMFNGRDGKGQRISIAKCSTLKSELGKVLHQLRSTHKGKIFTLNSIYALRVAVETAYSAAPR